MSAHDFATPLCDEWEIRYGRARHWTEFARELERKLAAAKDDRLKEAMALLAECEPCIDEWNFPITLGDRVKASLNEYYGDTRPHTED